METSNRREKDQSLRSSQETIPSPNKKQPSSYPTQKTSIPNLRPPYPNIWRSTMGEGGANRTSFNRLQVVQNTYLRLFFKKKDERINNLKIHTKANIPPLNQIILSLARNLTLQVQNHKNPLLNKLNLSDINKVPYKIKMNLPTLF